MKVLMVLGWIALALVLLSLVRVGGSAEYGEGGAVVKLRLGRLHFTLFPMKEKKEKRKKKKTPSQEPEGETGTAPGGSLELLREFFPLMTDAAGRMKQKIRIDRLDMDLTVAAGDPAAAAIAYGAANAGVGMMIPILENNFNIKERRLTTRVDFNRTSPTIWMFAAFSLTIGQAAAFSLRFGGKALALLSAHNQHKTKQKEAV